MPLIATGSTAHTQLTLDKTTAHALTQVLQGAAAVEPELTEIDYDDSTVHKYMVHCDANKELHCDSKSSSSSSADMYCANGRKVAHHYTVILNRCGSLAFVCSVQLSSIE